MDPLGIGDIIKLCEIAGRVYKNCTSFRHATRNT
jgi:hypothetical protein